MPRIRMLRVQRTREDAPLVQHEGTLAIEALPRRAQPDLLGQLTVQLLIGQGSTTHSIGIAQIWQGHQQTSGAQVVKRTERVRKIPRSGAQCVHGRWAGFGHCLRARSTLHSRIRRAGREQAAHQNEQGAFGQQAGQQHVRPQSE